MVFQMSRTRNQADKMLHAKFICAAFIAIALTAAHATKKTVGELMLFPIDDAEVRDLFINFNYDLTVLFYLYTRSNNSTPQQLVLDDVKALYQSDFDPKRKTMVGIHGFQSHADSDTFKNIKNAALEFYDVNVILVDWNYFSKNVNYAWVASKVDDVGAHVSKFIEFLISHGLKTVDLHLIGHSLGAHVAGFAGKELKANGHTPARITGLDPAYPGFPNAFGSKRRLSSEDAEFVDCIHTCGGKLGHPFAICQADFYPNGGSDVQPGCTPLDFGTCSHGRSHEYFAESMNPRHLFYAKSCKGIAIVVPFDCDDNGALMGYPASPKFKGTFTLKTNSEYPFAKNITTE